MPEDWRWLEQLNHKVKEIYQRKLGGTVTKAKLAEALVDRRVASRREAQHLVDSVFILMKEALQRGEDVLISGFGKFSVRSKNARPGRNPRTGERVIIKAHKTVTFQYSTRLRQKINQADLIWGPLSVRESKAAPPNPES